MFLPSRVEQNSVNIDAAKLYLKPMSVGGNTAESTSNERSEYLLILRPGNDSLPVPMWIDLL